MIIDGSDSTIKVKNAHGGHKETGWLERWANAHGVEDDWNIPCSNLTCFNEAEDGGHVIKVDSADKKEYIVPLCKSCNNPNNKKAFYVNEDVLEYAQDLKWQYTHYT